MASTDSRGGCVIIPAYREGRRIGGVVREVLRYCPDVLVVDDGSDDRTAEEARAAGAQAMRHPENRGKGAALATGYRYAREHGFEFVITLDGDGQHAPSDLPAFIQAYRSTGFPVLVGTRMDRAKKTMPLNRYLTNRLMSWLLSRKMGQSVPDTQCGYRLMRLDVVHEAPTASQRFDAESEVLLELAARGVRIGSVPIQVIYRDEKSKIRPLRDTFRFFRMLHNHDRARRAKRAGGGDL